MKFNPLRDWHFTLSMESPFEQANVFLDSLDIISWQNSNYNALESAIEQLSLLDDYYKIYAFPQVLGTQNAIKNDSSIKILNDFCNEFILSIDKSFSKLNDGIAEYKKISDKFKNEDSDKLNNYQDIYQFKNISTFLSILYVNLNKNPDLLHAFQIEYDLEEYNSLKELVNKAYNYQYGRFSFIIASRIIKLVDFENFKTTITDHIFKNVSYTDIHLNPDLTELIIDASFFDVIENHDDIEEEEEDDSIVIETVSDKDIITKKVSDEFYDLQLFDELSERNKEENNYYFEQLREPIKPNNETPFEFRKKSLKITYWQFTLLNNFFIREPETSFDFFESIIVEPESKINFWNIPEDNGNLIAVYNLKNIFGRKNKTKETFTLDRIKKQIYSPLPKIEFKDGILFNNPKWFEHSDDPFLYLRTTLFGYLSSQYFTTSSAIKNDITDSLIKLTVYNMRFHEEYNSYIKQQNHKDYREMLTSMNKLVNNARKSKRTFYACIGTEKQLSIERLLYERTKGISTIQDVNVFQFFKNYTSNFKTNYQLSYRSSYKDIYTNVLLPNVIFNWIYIIYQSLEVENKVLYLLSSVIMHESTLKKGNGKTFYSVSYFNKTRLSILFSFFDEDSLNFEFYDGFSFKKFNSKINFRNILTVSTVDDLKKLEDVVDKDDFILHKSIRQLEIRSKHNIFAENVESILDNLNKELASIIETKELDRLVRIQLIILLNNELLLTQENDTLREQILYLILEYGGIYDNDLLFKIVFENEDNILLQKKLIFAYYALIKKNNSTTNIASSPYRVLHNKNKIDFIKNKFQFLSCSQTNKAILDTLKENNDEYISFLYSKNNGFYQESIDEFSSKSTNKVHSIYYDPNTYSTSVLIKGKEQFAQTYNGKSIDLQMLSQINWNSLGEFINKERGLFEKEIKEYKKSEWFVDIVGIKKELIKSKYKVLSYKVDDKIKPFPLSLFQFICEFPSEKEKLRLVLIDKDYLNPITGIKGSLWSYAVGKNIFVTEAEFHNGTIDKLNLIYENITKDFNEVFNPTKGLVVFFKVLYNKGLQLSLIKNYKELVVNIDISYNLLSTINEAYNKNGKWYIDLKGNEISNLFTDEIQIILNSLPTENTINFDASDFLWNPFINEIKPKDNNTKIYKKDDRLKKDIKSRKKINYNEYQYDTEGYEYNKNKLEYYLKSNDKPNIKAKIDNSGNIELLNIKLPKDLIFPTATKTKWINKFNKHKFPRSIVLNSFSPNRYYDTFYNDFNNDYNAFVELRIWENELKIHTQKVKPFEFNDFSELFERLKRREKSKFQITYIGLYKKKDYKLNYNSNDELKKYVFEFGYGRIIVLNENQIKINKYSITNFKSVIFYGDRLTNIKIYKGILNCFKIEFDTSKLYNESLKKNIIHTLFIDSKTKRIKKVISSDNKLNISKNYLNYRGLLRLSKESISEINDIECQSGEIILYAKVNKDTNCKTIEFDIIKLSNNDDSLNNKLLFFKAENINYHNNTYKLKIIPLLNDDSSSISDEEFINNCYIKKRDFSSEANTLVNLYRERLDKSESFSSLIKDEILLVHLSYDRGTSKYNYSLIGSREAILSGHFDMPIRNEYIIHNKLESENITAVIINRNYNNKYRVELRPGIFVEVEINNKQDYFIHGDIVSLEKNNGKIYFKMLIPSDIRYFNGTKLISILPKSDIVEVAPNNISTDFYDRKYFIASEFANIELKLKRTDNLLNLLRNKNKHALINSFIANIDIPNNFKYKLVKLYIKNNRIIITSSDKKFYQIDYRQISFQEKPFQEIINLLIQSNWKYVDSETSIWNNQWKRVDLTNNRYTNTFVPAYNFQDDKITFRYPIYSIRNNIDILEISKVSLPSSVLVEHLRNSKGKISSVTFVCEDKNKIFLEISPARIIEVRKEYIKLFNSTFGLNNFPNQILGTGDTLILRLNEINHYNYEIDTIEILEWNPSGRSSYNEMSLIPMTKGKGYVKFGANMFSFIMPDTSSRNINKEDCYFVNTHINFFKRQDSNAVNDNSTSLLYKEDGILKITVPSLGDYKVIFRHDKYLNDWFTDKKIIQLLTVVRGYLPITIDNVDHNEKKIYISRKVQTKAIIDNYNILLSSIVGKLDDETFLIKSGSILLPFKVNNVKYVPKNVIMDNIVLSSITKNLRNRFYIIKINNEFIHGLNRSVAEEEDYDCSLLSIVNTKEYTGVIVLSKTNKTLHFVDYINISWVKLPNNINEIQIIQNIFKGNYFNEIKLNISAVNSFTNTGKATSEFNSFYKGKTITIEYVTQLKDTPHPTDGYKYYLVRSKFSGIVMLAESMLDEKTVQKLSMALVIDYSKKEKTVLVAIGEKSIMIDTYHLVFSNDNYRHIDIKEEFKNLLDNKDFEKLISIGDSLLKDNYLSVFKPLYYLKYVYDIIVDNHDNQEIIELKKIFFSIIYDISIRALRERHTEILISKWLNNKANKENKYLLWSRINKIGKNIFTNNNSIIVKDYYRAIENFNSVALPLRRKENRQELIELSDALMVAIGQNDGIVLNSEHSPIVTSILNLSIEYKKYSDNIFSDNVFVDNIEDIIKQCDLSGYFYLRNKLL